MFYAWNDRGMDILFAWMHENEITMHENDFFMHKNGMSMHEFFHA